MAFFVKIWWIVLVFVFISIVDQSSAGECCRSFVDEWGSYHSQKWCPVFCCVSVRSRARLECCSDINRRTIRHNVDHFCSSWWISPHNLWAPIIIGIVVIAIIIGSCICCIRCCCMF